MSAPRHRRPRRSRACHSTVVVVGAALVWASVLLPWLSGAAEIPGWRLANFLMWIGGVFHSTGWRWWGLFWYVIPFEAAAAWTFHFSLANGLSRAALLLLGGLIVLETVSYALFTSIPGYRAFPTVGGAAAVVGGILIAVPGLIATGR